MEEPDLLNQLLDDNEFDAFNDETFGDDGEGNETNPFYDIALHFCNVYNKCEQISF